MFPDKSVTYVPGRTFQTGFAEPRPEEAVLTLWLRRATLPAGGLLAELVGFQNPYH
jgi:hypothetical protein